MRETEIDRIGGTRFFECYYRGRLSYGVEQVSTGCKAVFNHNKRVLAAVKSVVSNSGNIARAYDNSLHIYHKGKKLFSLALFLFCLYNDIDPYNADLSNNVRHIRKRKRKKIEDCRADNLRLGGGAVTLDETNNILQASSNSKGFIDVFEPIPLLADILRNTDIVLHWNEYERLICYPKGQRGFTVADLAYLAYYDNLTMDNYIEKLAELKRYKKDNGLNIEHLDGNFHNHLKYNITLVAEEMNSKKQDMISYIKEPYFFTAVISGGKYKIVIGRADEDLMLDSDLFITEHFETVVGLLSAYRELHPDIFNKAEATANNKGLFYERFFCEAIADTAEERFIDLDKFTTPVEATEGV